MAREKLVLTYDDYRRMPEDHIRKEILGGDLYMTPAPSPAHQELVLELGSRLRLHISAHGLGKVFVSPVDVVLSPVDVVQPDIVFVRTSKLDIIGEEAIQGAPDLVIEVLSPSTAARDRGRKKDTYEHFGVTEYWIVDPENRVLEVYHLEGPAYRVMNRIAGGEYQPAFFPGLSLDVDRLWGALS